MTAVSRRKALQSVFSSAAAAAAIPAMLPGCAIAPAAASILKAAPYVPAAGAVSPDTPLLDLAARFHRSHEDTLVTWARYQSLHEGDPELLVLNASLDEHYEVWAGTSAACYTTAPQTVAGAVALLDVILTRDSDFIDAAVQTPLRLVRDSLAAMVPA